MSSKKYAYDVKFSEIIPRLMNLVKITKYKDLAPFFDISSQSLGNYKKKDKIAPEWIFRFAENAKISIDSLLKKHEPDLANSQLLRKIDMGNNTEHNRRVEDIHYCQVQNLIRETGTGLPEIVAGHPIVKLFLHKDSFQRDCNISSLKYIVLSESNMAPTVPAGSILVVDQEEKGITESLYILKINDVYLLKRIQPLNNNKVRVISDNPKYETFTIDLDEIAPMIFGRVIWIVLKI